MGSGFEQSGDIVVAHHEKLFYEFHEFSRIRILNQFVKIREIRGRIEE